MQSSNETFEKGHFKGHLKRSGALKQQCDIGKLLWELGVLPAVHAWQEPFGQIDTQTPFKYHFLTWLEAPGETRLTGRRSQVRIP